MKSRLSFFTVLAVLAFGFIPAAWAVPNRQVEISQGRDTAKISRAKSRVAPGEVLTRKRWASGVTWKVAKWSKTSDFRSGRKPDTVVQVRENGLTNGGITEMLKLLAGTGGTAYSNSNAYIKVGNSTTAFSAGQTDLQGASTDQAAMDATYPQVSGQTVTWKSTFGSSAANFAWEEVGVKNGSGAVSGSILLLNRKVSSFGTKASGSTWTMTLTVTIS